MLASISPSPKKSDFPSDIVHSNIPEIFKPIINNIKELKNILLNNEMGVILKPIKEMIHIFDELYYINPDENKLYAQIKVLELLLVFTAIPINNENKKKRYIEKEQVDKIKKIHNELISNLDKKITIEMLSKKYNIGTTPLKIYFKEIYGEPIYTYLKDYKIHRALHLSAGKLFALQYSLRDSYQHCRSRTAFRH